MGRIDFRLDLVVKTFPSSTGVHLEQKFSLGFSERKPVSVHWAMCSKTALCCQRGKSGDLLQSGTTALKQNAKCQCPYCHCRAAAWSLKI